VQQIPSPAADWHITPSRIQIRRVNAQSPQHREHKPDAVSLAIDVWRSDQINAINEA
jgi:hypothetical protein